MKIKVYFKNGEVKYHTFNMYERASVVYEWLSDKYDYRDIERWEEL